MVERKLQCTDFSVKLVCQTVVKAAVDHNVDKPSIFPLSNLDRLAEGTPVTYLYVYHRPATSDLSPVLNTITSALSECLRHFYPFAGRIVRNPKTNEADVLCNNQGVRLIEASANVPLAKLDLFNLNSNIKNLLLPVEHDNCPVSVQVTSYACGGYSISWTIEHSLADAYGAVKFLTAICEIARTKKLLVMPSIDRQSYLPRSPPTCSPLIDRMFTVYSMDDMLRRSTSKYCSTEKHLYMVMGSALESLRAEASNGGTKRTRTEALSAYLWKLMAKALAVESDQTRFKIGVLVDGRKRIDHPDHLGSSLNYAGNLVSTATGEASIKDLKEGSLANAAGIVSQAIHEVTNRAHFLDLIDWVECHQPSKVAMRTVVGHDAPALIVSSCPNVPFMDMDFGFGSPALGTCYTAMDKFGAGFVNFISSGRNDGSWFVFAFLWPDVANALELDPAHVFEPITTDHLGL